MKKTLSPQIFLIIGLLGYVFILALTLFHKQPPLFDEAYFVRNFELFRQYGLTKAFLVRMDNQAPGPLYELVHFAFKPFTHLTTPGIRLVNVFLLGVTILLSARVIAMLKKWSFSVALPFAVALMAVPMVWQVTGLALTEMPTMFFSILSSWLLILAVRNEHFTGRSVLLAIAAGICFGLSIWGRSPFLTLGVAAGMFLLYNAGNVKRWRTLIIYGACGLAMAIPVFLAWNGLVPPQQAFVGKGFNAWHGILAYAYGALLTLIIAPGWFYFNRKTILYLIACYAILLLINLYGVRYEYAPLDKALEKVMPAAFMKVYPLLISPLLATFSLYFIANCIRQGWMHRRDGAFLFLLTAGMLILASSFKVTHLFSTRYVAQAAPFFVLVFPGYDRHNWSRLLRFLIGMGIGFLSLETYFHFM